jgi:hypothetical protein
MAEQIPPPAGPSPPPEQPPPPPPASIWPPTPPPSAPPPWTPTAPPPSRRRALILGALAAILIGLVVVVIVVVTGRNSQPAGSNGESAKSAHEMLVDSSAAFSGAHSVHLTGNGSVTGETNVYNLHLTTEGAQGTITANGTAAEFVAIGNDVYVRGRAFFEKFSGPDAAGVIGDRWLHTKFDDPRFGKYFQILSLQGITGMLSGIAQANAGGGVFKGSTVHDDGTLAMTLRATDGGLDVALDGRPYPLRLHFSDKGTSADLHFSEYDAPTTPPARPTDVLDVPGLPSA